MDNQTERVERGLAQMGYVVLIALFILAPPPKQPVVLVVALLLAYIFCCNGRGRGRSDLSGILSPHLLGWPRYYAASVGPRGRPRATYVPTSG
jgi:hypothetical protein